MNDIAENPYDHEIVEFDAQSVAKHIDEVSYVVLNGNYALEGGLKVKDALAVENADGVAAQTYKNVVVTKAENKDNPALVKLVEALQSQEIQDYINNTYDGAVVPVQ